MKKTLYRIWASALLVVCFTSFFACASAVSRASSYITKYTANVAAAGGGEVQVMFSVIANTRVSELGASYILLEESNDGGKSWSVAREYEDESWMSTTNRSTYNRATIYQGTVGYQYRVTAEVFAKDENGSDSRRTPTSPVITATR